MSLNTLSAPRFVFFAWLGLVIATVARGDELRTWTDSTGRHELQAKFVSVKDGEVTLVREDGAKLAIALEKLSKADQEYVAKLKSDSPFKPVEDSPFIPVKPRPETSQRGPRNVTVDWSRSEIVALDAAGAEWNITPPDARPLDFRPRSVALPPKTDFFEKLSGMAVNAVAKKAVVSYTLARHGSEATTRIVFCDIERGRTSASGAAPGQMAALALHDDGQHVLMRRDEFGFGNLDRLEIWSVQGKEALPSLVWKPYDDVQGAARDVMWAEFVDASTLATSSRGGRVALWDVASAQPICHFQLVDGAVPAMSADRKWIAFSSQDRIGLFDVEKREVAAVQDTPAKLTWPYMAFSPSGRRIGCIAQDRILVWDTASGQLEKNFATPGIHIHGAIDFPDDGFILAANQFLYREKPVWETSGTNIPGFLMLKRGENVEGVLRRASAQPSYEFYDRVVLPEFLQKPSDNQRPGAGQTLGVSMVTPTGFR